MTAFRKNSSKGLITVFRAKEFIFTIQINESVNKLFQIWFWKDWSIYVRFPYFNDSRGILSELPLNLKWCDPTELSLKNGWKVTTNRVKYSHHRDGEAHFSQDWRINTKIRKKSVPLSTLEGHLFTVQLQESENFSVVSNEKDQPNLNSERTVIKIEVPPDNAIEAMKFVWYWYSSDTLAEENPIGPTGIISNNKWGWVSCFFITGLESIFNDRILLITYESIHQFTIKNGPHLIFLGGFDEKSEIADLTRVTTALSLSYPISEEEIHPLREEIGTVDRTEDV